jgi:transcriptional regulator with XRE-family HTH domain
MALKVPVPDCVSAIVARGLRAALGVTQEALAGLTGEARLSRVEINNVESGRNRATSARIQIGLRQAFGLTDVDMAAALTGRLPLEEAIKRSATIAASKAARKNTGRQPRVAA